ncbi:MAG TPA: molybdopterin-dependent oxidoreductase [Verrucomicrobiae bacterium]|nr:molybdopterin-dependent oxidoreductase [Verrucomicrobiae bacterium]
MSLDENGAQSKPAKASPPGPESRGVFPERSPEIIEVTPQVARRWTRRNFLTFGAGAVVALGVAASQLPPGTLQRLGLKFWPRNQWLLNKAQRVDDDVAELLYSPNRLVPTYTKSQITPLRNNYNGATPDPGYIPRWRLTLDGLSSGLTAVLDIQNLLNRFQIHDQITRLVCVEGWSAIAWWSGLRFENLLQAYPPVSQAKWAQIESSVNLDPNGNPDPYYVSLDLLTARHPQTLLATHYNGQPLTVEHGAPLRLIAPMKFGLKNIKAITRVTYVKDEPKDYWAERGYSSYDGI